MIYFGEFLNYVLKIKYGGILCVVACKYSVAYSLKWKDWDEGKVQIKIEKSVLKIENSN